MTVQATPPKKKSSAAKWLLAGCGCLVLCAIIAVVAIVLIFGGVSAMIKKSEPYKNSVKLLEMNPEVRQEIGSVDSFGFPMGSFNESEGTGTGNFRIPVTGTKGKGSLEVDMRKSGGSWHFERADFVSSTGRRIDLLKSMKPPSKGKMMEEATPSAGTEPPSEGSAPPPANWAEGLKPGSSVTPPESEPGEEPGEEEEPSSPQEPASGLFSEVTMCRSVSAQQKPVDPTSVYPPDAPAFYCSVLMGSVPGDTKVKAVYRVDSVEGFTSNQKIDEVELTVPAGRYASFSLKRSMTAWPEGTYRVDLYCRDVVVRSVKFDVQK